MCTYLKPYSGTYYFRRIVPEELRPLFPTTSGKPRSEWRVSLHTKDKELAKRKLPAYVSETNDLIDQARAAMAAAAREVALAPTDQQLAASHAIANQMELGSLEAADYFAALYATEDAQAETDPLFALELELRAAKALELRAVRDKVEAREALAGERAKRAVSFMELFEDWSAKYGKPDTVAAYRSYAQFFSDHVGKADANLITEDDVASWRNRLENEGGLSGKQLSPKTINGAYMCAINAIFERARGETRRVRSNPAAGLRALRNKKQPQLREKSITDEEALLILADAMQPGSDRLSPRRASAKRWCQWLMAYSGARVTEIAQLRKEDVGEANGIPYIFITPEAGKTKTEVARKVPLHPHLIQQGFLDFVAEQASGPLFYDPELGRGGRLASQSKKVGQFLCGRVRKLEVTVAQPNHGWRHRMETVNNRYDLRDKNVRMILGHKERDSNEAYGDHELPAMLREIKRLPAYQGPGLPPFNPETE